MYSSNEFYGNVSFPEMKLNIPGIYSIEYYYHFNCQIIACSNSDIFMTINFEYENIRISIKHDIKDITKRDATWFKNSLNITTTMKNNLKVLLFFLKALKIINLLIVNTRKVTIEFEKGFSGPSTYIGFDNLGIKLKEESSSTTSESTTNSISTTNPIKTTNTIINSISSTTYSTSTSTSTVTLTMTSILSLINPSSSTSISTSSSSSSSNSPSSSSSTGTSTTTSISTSTSTSISSSLETLNVTSISSIFTSTISKEDEKDTESKLSPLNLILICALVPSVITALIGIIILHLIHKKRETKVSISQSIELN